MKKVVSFIFVVLLALSVFASQETYRAESYEVQTFKSLCRITGDNLVDPTYPISGDHLLSLLENLSVSKMDDQARLVYENLVSSLHHANDIKVKLSLNFNSALYVHTSDDEIKNYQLFYPLRDRVGGIGVDAKFWWDDYAYGRFNYKFSQNDTNEAINKKFAVTWPIIVYDDRAPQEAHVSLGFKKLNLTVGRDRYSAGNGSYFNLFMADNFVFHDGVKLSLLDPRYSYDLTVISTENENDDMTLVRTTFNGPSSTLFTHRFSASLFNKITASLYETMLQYSDNPFDWRLINPFMILHNTGSFFSGYANNAVGIELSSNLGKGFGINAQIFIDQAQSNEEIEDVGRGNIAPNAFALLAGASYSSAFLGGTFDSWIEGVYTSPVCYLKEYYPRMNEDLRWYYLDFLLGNYTIDECFQYLGYYYGPNSIGFDCGARYNSEKLSLSFIADYHFTGTYKRGDYMDTSWEYFYKMLPLCIGEDKVLEHDLVLGAKANYQVFKGLDVFASLGWLASWNYNNIKNNTFSDVQATLGVKADAIALCDKFFNWSL